MLDKPREAVSKGQPSFFVRKLENQGLYEDTQRVSSVELFIVLYKELSFANFLYSVVFVLSTMDESSRLIVAPIVDNELDECEIQARP
jgi:hypothetical protein